RELLRTDSHPRSPADQGSARARPVGSPRLLKAWKISAMPSSPSHFDAVRGQETEKLLYQFDEAWLAGTVPAIEEFLKRQTAMGKGHDASGRGKCLEELVKIDLEYRWRRKPGGGKPWSLEDYVARYPDLGRLDSLALDLIAAEYRVRQRWGDRPTQAEYSAR